METLGQKLYAARTKKKLTASEAAKGTRIKIQHIQAMERDDFSSVPAAAYAKGFIKIYAEYLEIDPAPLIKEYLDTHAPKERASLLPEEEQQDGSSGRPSNGRSFQLPSFPEIPWKKIRDLIKKKTSKIARSRFRVPGVPPRRLVIYSGGLALFLLFLFTVVRCGRTPEEEASPVIEDPVVVDPAPAGAAYRPEGPLPRVDALPEPYLE